METSITWLDRMIDQPSSRDWHYLLEIYAPLLSLWASRAGVPATDQDDLVQEVAIVVFRRIGDFRHQHPGAFRGWLRIILANHLKHYFRSKQAHAKVRFALDDMTDHRTQLSQLFDLEHDQFLASRAMKMAAGDFSPTTWAAFELQVVQNLPAEVVADRLGLSVNAVLKSKSRVLKRIRQELTRLAC